jgi:pimeloyl-ACP methyl ester carboxylesterase
MTTFGLVHGAYHGAWCWQPLIAELEQRGHQGRAVDLPCEDPEAGAIEYATAAIEAFADAGPDLVVVGHSLGGLSIPLIAERRPVARLVYLCALVPRPGRAHADVMREEPDIVGSAPARGAYIDENGASRWRQEAAAGWFFADCQPDVASWAASKLRGQFWRITEEVCPLQAWPDAPSTAVIGARDPVISPAWSRRVTPAILGVTPIELDCGHSPFLSATAPLADALLGIK